MLWDWKTGFQKFYLKKVSHGVSRNEFVHRILFCFHLISQLRWVFFGQRFINKMERKKVFGRRYFCVSKDTFYMALVIFDFAEGFMWNKNIQKFEQFECLVIIAIHFEQLFLRFSWAFLMFLLKNQQLVCQI